GEEHHLAVHMSRCAARGLNKRRLAAQKSFLIRVENADERNFREIETFTEQIDADQDVEVGGAQSAQDFDALDRVDVAVQIAHFQSNITQIIGEVYGGPFRQRCHENSFISLHSLPA